ncbi:MAG TPA: GNAT family N-acetyltransferase [Flavobacteriales bacterium]|nr:GNAT family N-acetyltransferase [Flavobacteriales bacterium]
MTSTPSNYERLLALADAVFAVRSDPAQLDVDEAVLDRLRRIHPASVQEKVTPEGPIAWLLFIPTTRALMDDFVHERITERELCERTPEGATYHAVYLCSGLVLPEHRRKGVARELGLRALEAIRRDHPIQALCVWTFSEAGRAGAKALAAEAGLPLLERPARH